MTTFINHDNKIIFVHTPKTGGTSITDCMVGLEQSHAAAKLFGMPTANVDFWKGGAHATTTEIKEKYELFDDYNSFTVMREPYSWLISLFCHLNYPTFSGFVNDFHKINDSMTQLQSYWFTVDGRVDVDLVIDFDCLDEQINQYFNTKHPIRTLNKKNMLGGTRDFYASEVVMKKATDLLEPDLKLYEELFGKRWEL